MVGYIRRALELMYKGLCTITHSGTVKDEDTGLDRSVDEVIAEGIPCRLSFGSSGPAAQTETAAMSSQTVKLFLAPEVPIKPGARVSVQQNGQTYEYNSCGDAAVYSTHQEVMLTVKEQT